MSLHISRSQIYDFMEYIVNDSTGTIGTIFMDHAYAINQLLQRNPRAIMYYNMYVTYFENNKKYLKQENLPCDKFKRFDSIDSLIESATNHSIMHNKNIVFTFCLFSWLYMHH